MYLFRLYKFNRPAAVICCLLLAGYAYINVKWGLVATPLLQHGMYSQPVPIDGNRTVYQLLDSSGNDLMKKLSFYQKDQLTFYLNNLRYRSSNEHVLAVFTPILRPFRADRNPGHFGIVPPADAVLENWIPRWLNSSLGRSVPAYSIRKITAVAYRWSDRLIQTSDAPSDLIQYGNGK